MPASHLSRIHVLGPQQDLDRFQERLELACPWPTANEPRVIPGPGCIAFGLLSQHAVPTHTTGRVSARWPSLAFVHLWHTHGTLGSLVCHAGRVCLLPPEPNAPPTLSMGARHLLALARLGFAGATSGTAPSARAA